MQNVHLLQVHIQRNRAWLQKHTEGQELSSYLTNMAQVRVCQLKKKIDLGISNTKEKDSVGHAKVVQNSTYTKNIINSHSSPLPPCRKSKHNYLTLLLFFWGGWNYYKRFSGMNMHSNR